MSEPSEHTQPTIRGGAPVSYARQQRSLDSSPHADAASFDPSGNITAAFERAASSSPAFSERVHPHPGTGELPVQGEGMFAQRAATALAIGRNVVAQAASSEALSGIRTTASAMLRAVQTALGTSRSTDVDAYGKDSALVKELGAFGSFLYDSYWRVKVEGAEKIPTGAAILVANHSGAVPVDGPVLHAALRRERSDLGDARWLIEDQLFYAPFLGTLLNRLGAVRACPENAVRLLGEARPVIVFPEGIQGISKPFSERYRLMRFGRGGFVKLALRARVPIVPIAIVGGEESSPLIARIPAKPLGMAYVPVTSPLPLPARWTIRVGEPLSMDAHAPEQADDLLLVNRLNERTRETIQGMLESMLKARTSVFA